MIKADDKVKYDEETAEKFTHFEELKVTVELLKEQLDEIAYILQENDITRIKEVEAPYFDEDDLCDRLSSK